MWVIWTFHSDQGQGHRGQPNGQNEHILRIFTNFSLSFHPIITKIGEDVQNKPTKKRKKPEFWIFDSVDFYVGSNVTKIQKIQNALFFRNSISSSISPSKNKNSIILYLQLEFKNIDFWPNESKKCDNLW